MISTSRKKSSVEGLRAYWARRRGIWALAGALFLFYASWPVMAQEKERVLEDIVIREAPVINPATPVTTRYGTQYNVVTEEQLKQQSSFDFHSALRNVPGVMFQSKNLLGDQTSHSLYIRGRGASHPSSDFAIEFDGAPRYGALFGQVLGDSIALSTIGGIEVYKSPQPSQFGSGYASVNVLPKYLTEDGQEIGLNFSGGSYCTFDQSLAGGRKKGPFDFYLVQSWVSTDGHRENSRAQQQNYYANLGYEFSKEWNIRLLASYVDSQTVAPRPAVTPTPTNGISWPMAERFDTGTFFTTLTLNHQYERFGGYLKAYWDNTDFDLLQELTNGQRYGGGTGGLKSRQEISLYGVRLREKLHLWSGGEILAGVDLDKTELKNTQRTYSGLAVPGINGGLAARVWEFPDIRILSPYIAVSQLFGDSEGFRIVPSAGFRYFDHNEFKDKSSGQAGLVAGYQHTELNFSYARGINYPSPVAIMNLAFTGSTVVDPSRFWKELKPEVVDHHEVGLTHTWPELASLGLTLFKDKGKDRFRTYMFGPIPLQWNDTVGSYEIRGIELTGTVTPVKNLELFAGTTWLDVKARGSDGIERDFMPYTPDFQFQAGLTWTFLQKYKLYMDLQHLRGLYQGTNFRTQGFNFVERAESDKLDNITLVNARISYGFDYKPWRVKDSEIFLAVNNLFDADYEYAKGYSMPGVTVFAGSSMKFK